MPCIDFETVDRVASIVARILSNYDIDNFTNTEYYPPSNTDPELVTSYFLVMVAMDHRLSRPNRPYEAIIDGKLYHGADLLYKMGMAKFNEDPEFFTARRLATIQLRDVLNWLCVKNVCPPDPQRRLALLRDLGIKLLRVYDGRVLSLIEGASGRLHGVPENPGFIELLQVFKAYNDPVEKKPMLLAKFLERRGILRINDRENKRVPVDNHVTRIALRLGIVKLEEKYKLTITRLEHVDRWTDIAIRITVREAWHYVAQKSGYDDFLLDDLLWDLGRSICIRRDPHCNECKGKYYCRGDGLCPFYNTCTAATSRDFINEHLFINTWWY